MIKTEEILIKNNRGQSFCDLFLYEPENIEEASLGNLYIVAEAVSNKDSFSLVGLLSSLIKREYYSLPHRGPLQSLEAGLKKANITLNELAAQGNLEWLGKLHFICAVLNKEEDLFLTQTGASQALLSREGHLTSITKKLVPQPQKTHPAKTFQSVISGKLEPEDRMILATPALFDLISPPGLKQLLQMAKIEHICDHINKTLRENRKVPPLGALLLEIIPEQPQSQESETRFTTPPIDLADIINSN